MLHDPILILNQNYQPLNICNTRRALVLISLGKAEIMLDGRGTIQSISKEFEIPYVIRLYYMVKKPVIRQRLSRRSVFYRDDFTCQYCGSKTRTLTLNHITPRSRGGTHAWENVTSACTPCNHIKAGRTPPRKPIWN